MKRTVTIKDPAVVAQARELGKLAFERGAMRIPAQDPAVMPLLKGHKVGEGIPVLDAWLKGWDQANLAPTYFATVKIAGEEFYGCRNFQAIKSLNEPAFTTKNKSEAEQFVSEINKHVVWDGVVTWEVAYV